MKIKKNEMARYHRGIFPRSKKKSRAKDWKNLHKFYDFVFYLLSSTPSEYLKWKRKVLLSFIFALTLAPIIRPGKKCTRNFSRPLQHWKREKEENYRLPFILISSIFFIYFPFALLINILSKAFNENQFHQFTAV